MNTYQYFSIIKPVFSTGLEPLRYSLCNIDMCFWKQSIYSLRFLVTVPVNADEYTDKLLTLTGTGPV